VQNMVTSCR